MFVTCFIVDQSLVCVSDVNFSKVCLSGFLEHVLYQGVDPKLESLKYIPIYFADYVYIHT